MLFSWFDAREEYEFGTRLAEFCDQKFREIAKAADSKQEEKRRKLIAQTLQQVSQFAASRRLNIYKKAKLGNAFKWKLADLGHDKELVDTLTKEVLLVLG